MAISGSAAGHPNIRATHGKTLELGRESEIGDRATCVVGVSARIDEDGLAELHGPVVLTLSAGGHQERVRGRLNPRFAPGDPLVVRRAPALTRDAVIVGADRAASDLARSFVAALTEPGARIAVTVEERAGETGPGVLVLRAGEDRAPPGGIAAVSGEIAAASGEIAAALAGGRRVELAAQDADPGIVRAAHEAGHAVIPAPGLPLGAAVRAVGGLPPECELVEGVRAEQLERRLERTGAERGAVVLDPGTPREEFLVWRRGEPLEIPGARGRRAAFAVERRGGRGTERAEALAAAGASTRDVARALQRDAGLPHRRAYEFALGLTADTSSVARPDPRTSR